MEKMEIGSFTIAGLALQNPTSNVAGQSSLDCLELFKTFQSGGYGNNIVGKIGDELYGVYYKYHGDSSQPFLYMVGVHVDETAVVHPPLSRVQIPAGIYLKWTAKGTLPECVTDIWKAIWKENYPRT
ncbi:MAG: effector binding domain-containing protein [Agriterribacter sp.]